MVEIAKEGWRVGIGKGQGWEGRDGRGDGKGEVEMEK